MSRFIQLEYSWKEYDGPKTFTEMLIVNLDHVISADVQDHRVVLFPKESIHLTDRGWSVLMEAVQPTTKETP